MEKTEQRKRSGQPMIRRVWRTGKGAKEGKGSYITALPTHWASRLKSKEVAISEFKNGLFLVPIEAKGHKMGRLKFKGTNANFIKYQIISAYLNNFRKLYIELEQPNKECIQMIESLPKKLLGLTPAFAEEDNTRLIIMSSLTTPIPEILERMLALSQRIHKINQKIMSGFVLSEDQLENVKAMEDDIDRNSFLIKRLCCIATDEPNLAKRVGIDDLVKITHWETLNSNLERVGDLQFETCLELNRLRKDKKKEALDELQSKKAGYSFKDYHNAAQTMVNDAFSNEPRKIAEIISTKRSGIENGIVLHRGDYITEKQGDTIIKAVERIPDLACLNFRIWLLTACSTNIAEAWLNMRGPANLISKQK